MQALITGLKCLLSMLRCMLGSVKVLKVKTLRRKGNLGNGKGGDLNNLYHHNLYHHVFNRTSEEIALAIDMQEEEVKVLINCWT